MLKRNNFIDYLRGIAIIDMILVHYCWAFPEIISKIISYQDVAIEGFILLSGVIVGKYYFPKFIENKSHVLTKILTRILKIIIIQYLIIIFVSFPKYIITTGDININTSIIFLIKSFSFYNQVGLVHILPTFIPLFAISPLLLYLLSLNLDWIVLLSSACFFILGQYKPYIINYGDITIFPVILWQIYFVAGCFLGKRSNLVSSPAISNKIVILSLLSLLVALIAKHSPLLNIISLKLNYDIVIGRFPLNLYGLAFGSSLWLFIYSMSKLMWPTIKVRSIIGLVSLFGRHSLLVFVIHLCFAKILECYRFFNVTNFILLYSIIFMNFLLTYYVLCQYELYSGSKGKVFPKVVKWLFN